jgi:uncharacterized protein YdhG (YjbR/CyaY superfamily)
MAIAPDVETYIAGFPPEVQLRLHRLRATIRKAVPKAVEKISYGMPTYALKRNLIHFAGFKNHIGVYPTPGGIEEFAKALAPYTSSKGAVQFPHDKPMPYALIGRIAKFRAKQDAAGG